MDHARHAPNAQLSSITLLCLAGVLSACGFGGRVELGDNAGSSALAGAVASGGSSSDGDARGGTAHGGAASGGAMTAPGGAGAFPIGSSGGAGFGPLPMDATGVVPTSSNAYGIQGKWYAFSDEVDGGQTRIDGYYETMVPFVAGHGMCIHGTTQSGLVDNWQTWGAGIGIALNVVGDKAETLPNPPSCFTLVISADATYPMELRADLNPTDDGSVMPPNVPLHPGSNEVCLRDAQTFQYCTPAMVCLPPESLQQGLAKINVVAPSSTTAGPISFCIESLTPHD